MQKQHSNAIAHTNNTSTTWAGVFDIVLKEVVDIPLPYKVDLFFLDGIFKTASVPTRDRTKNNFKIPSGLNSSFSKLKRMAHTQPQSSVAWGNTNTVCFCVVLGWFLMVHFGYSMYANLFILSQYHFSFVQFFFDTSNDILLYYMYRATN